MKGDDNEADHYQKEVRRGSDKPATSRESPVTAQDLFVPDPPYNKLGLRKLSLTHLSWRARWTVCGEKRTS